MRILLVHADASILRTLSEIIRRRGVQCESYTLPTAALQRIVCDSYDLVMVDYNLETMDGYEFAMRSKKFRGETPVIIMSGNSIREREREYIRSRGVYILFHPLNMIMLNAILDKISCSEESCEHECTSCCM